MSRSFSPAPPLLFPAILSPHPPSTVCLPLLSISLALFRPPLPLPHPITNQVHATDGDGSFENSQLSYHIIDGNYDDAFVIDPPFSGIVKTNIKLDRETYASYRLAVRAVDSGMPAKSPPAILRIAVVDVNDNEPR